jgi:hypothetical protein
VQNAEKRKTKKTFVQAVLLKQYFGCVYTQFGGFGIAL